MNNDCMYVGPYFQCDAGGFSVDADDNDYDDAFRKLNQLEEKTTCECIDPFWDMCESEIALGEQGKMHWWIEREAGRDKEDKVPNNERPFYYSCHAACVNHIDAEQVTQEMQEFVRRHERDRRLLQNAYGRRNVKIKWGIIHADRW